jgi:hypothetical protein
LDLKGFIGILQDADDTQTAKERKEKLGISVRRYMMIETGTGTMRQRMPNAHVDH